MTVAFALAVVVYLVYELNNGHAAASVGVFSLLGYYLGRHEGDGLH